jgi:hypothetical protein
MHGSARKLGNSSNEFGLPQPVSDNGMCSSQAISADLTGTSRIVGLVGEKGKLFDCTFVECIGPALAKPTGPR